MNLAVSNTGPILHLHEIELIKSLNIFEGVYLPEEVNNELIKNKIYITKIKKIKVVKLEKSSKDKAKLFSEQYSLDLGEAESISLCFQNNVNLFLTDDLDARTVARNYNLEVHGTIGVILRAFKEDVIDKQEAVNKILELYTKSSLFITKDIVSYILSEIKKYK